MRVAWVINNESEFTRRLYVSRPDAYVYPPPIHPGLGNLRQALGWQLAYATEGSNPGFAEHRSATHTFEPSLPRLGQAAALRAESELSSTTEIWSGAADVRRARGRAKCRGDHRRPPRGLDARGARRGPNHPLAWMTSDGADTGTEIVSDTWTDFSTRSTRSRSSATTGASGPPHGRLWRPATRPDLR